jgi:hypothetical protein
LTQIPVFAYTPCLTKRFYTLPKLWLILLLINTIIKKILTGGFMAKKTDYKEDIDRPIAIFDTNMGTFEVELYAKECPETVWNFINLAEGRQETSREGNFYDKLTFHRVIKDFMIQGGCPIGNGTG